MLLPGKNLEKTDMSTLKKLMLFLLAAGYASVAGDSAGLATPLHGACKADIEKYCSNVEPGDGRLLACLYAHEDKVSEACDDATADMSNIVDAALSAVGDTVAQCVPDIQKHCSGTEFGDGQMLSCLYAHRADIHKDCAKGVNFYAEVLKIE
jgi:hypothetical protein